jgi:TonB-linked SusC/RagA family outer membrane protein
MKKGSYIIATFFWLFAGLRLLANEPSLPGGQNLMRPLYGRDIQVSGIVTSSENQEPLIGVNVQVKGASLGTTTDAEGKYELLVPNEDAVLIFSYVGYLTQEIQVSNQTAINVSLIPDETSLTEVVVVGYGTQRRSDLTGSVISINTETIDKQGPKVNPLQALQGVVPGLNITQNSNDAAQNSFNISIRGRNSIKASDSPLIVLDGVPYSGGFNEIDQNDIKSIEVLKDASAAAIYGARGANGVILITTKNGALGKPTISYDGSYGVQQIYNLPPVLTGEAFYNFALTRVGEKIVNQYPTGVQVYKDGQAADWLALVTRDGQQQRHTLKFSGGTERINYFLSGAYTDVSGIAKGDDFNQVIARANLSLHLTDWLTIGTNTQYTSQDQSGLGVDIVNAYFFNPLARVYEADGTYAVLPIPEEPIYSNPLSNLYVQDEDKNQRLFSNNYVSITFPFVQGLSYKFNTGYNVFSGNIGRFWGSNTRTGLLNGGQSFISNNNQSDVLLENILSYQRNFKKHRIDFTALYSTQHFTQDVQQVTAQRFPTEVLSWYQNSVAGVIQPSASFSEQKYESQMGRLNYGFDSRYLLTLTVRRDGYSGFGNANKYGVFPSLAVGWNISNEPFFKENKTLNLLKLRASYGLNGNQAISPYQTLAQLSQLNFLGGPAGNTTAPGYFPSTLSTPTLGWETSRSVNGGIDFALFSDRLRGSVDAYTTETEDLLLDRAISPVHGITTVTQNIGKVRNTGIEVLLNTVNIRTPHFSWSTDVNFSHNRNEIIDLYGTGQDDVSNGWFIGKSIDANFALVYDGVWQTGEDVSLQPTAKPGDVKIKDTNGDGKITVDDRTFIGQRNPKYVAGLTNTVTYKGVALSFFLFTQQGVTRVNPLWDTDVVLLDARRNTIRQNWWSETNPTNDYPANRNITNPFGVRFYQDASFVRLRDVTLSYTLPQTLTHTVGFRYVKVYGNIRNALTFTNWKGLDPELGEQRGIPLDRSFILGLNLGL